jgi:hypothetical protein
MDGGREGQVSNAQSFGRAAVARDTPHPAPAIGVKYGRP